MMNMKNVVFMVVLLLSYNSISNAANILAIYTLASPSQHLWHSHLLVALASKGHNITVLSAEAQKKPVPNIKNLIIEGLYDSVSDGYSYEDMADASNLYWIKETYVFLEKGCMVALTSDGLKQLLNYPPETKFDLLLMESSGVECLLGILPKFGNPPIVTVNGLSIPPWLLEMTSTPANPSYVPNFYMPYDENMKFTERLHNFIACVYSHILYNYDYLPKMEKEAKKFFGPQTPSVSETMKNVSIALSNVHPVFDSPIPFPPNVIPIAGIQVRDPKPLPDDIQTFLDEASEGAIYFSLGTNVRSDRLSPEKIKVILEVFAELPQRVLWKFESDLPGVPENVKIGKFFPQSDILAHPNVRAFVSHAGLLSSQEAMARGVPIVGMPFIVDQNTNIQRLAARGCAVLLEYRRLNKASLLHALREVLHNPSYRENMKKLSAVFTDEPQTPLERAVFWAEYVIRHKGAPHFKSGAKNLNWLQYLLLDVIGFLLFAPALVVYVLYSACRRKKPKSTKKHKQN